MRKESLSLQMTLKQGMLSGTTLSVGYGNLATMHRGLGKAEAADRYEAMSTRLRRTHR